MGALIFPFLRRVVSVRFVRTTALVLAALVFACGPVPGPPENAGADAGRDAGVVAGDGGWDNHRQVRGATVGINRVR